LESLHLDDLFPVPVCSALRRIPDPGEEPLLADPEREAVRRAVPKRKVEFAAGRDCAKAALRSMGVAVEALPRCPDGRAEWPGGVVGAITHSEGLCAAVVARAEDAIGLGLDLESIGRMSPGAARHVLSPAELEDCERHDLGQEAAWAVKFSAKESVYKCLYPLVQRYIGFEEAEISASPDGSLTATLGPALERELPEAATLVGRYQVAEGRVLTGFVLRADGDEGVVSRRTGGSPS